MKKLAIPLLAGLVALGTLTLAQPAGATKVSPTVTPAASAAGAALSPALTAEVAAAASPGGGTGGPTVTLGCGQSDTHVIPWAKCVKKGDVSISADQSHVAVSFGWVIYIHFYHGEIGASLLTAWLAGTQAAILQFCTDAAIAVPPAGFACLIVATFFTSWFIQQMVSAYQAGDGFVMKFTYIPFGQFAGLFFVPDSWT